VGGQTTTALVVALLTGTLIVLVIYVPRFLLKKAMRNVVSLFRERGAISPMRATTPEELGLVPGSPFDRVLGRRDYRPNALRLLGQANIIRTTEESKLYLSEEELEHSPAKRFARIE
jgi:hypothetical protein